MNISIPDIDTLRQLCEQLKTESGAHLSQDFLDFIFRQRIGNKALIRDEYRHSIIDMMGLISSNGEEHMRDLIQNNQGKELHEIIRRSTTFRKARKEDFLTTTTDLKERATLSSIVQCPKCRSNDVETRTVQRRAGDESSTDDNRCRKCGFNFSIT
jgi:DNA-directed RNA polymerase subunit M/transcription elongation factor TFIIS